jgi:RNA recognition motif-containing protein
MLGYNLKKLFNYQLKRNFVLIFEPLHLYINVNKQISIGVNMNIFVGNIAPQVSDQELEDAFAKHGKVKSAKVVRDLFSQESKGFGFVEMMNRVEATTAIKEMNTIDLKGKRIVVNEARPERKGGRRR